jgi:UBX domain-containing protein 1
MERASGGAGPPADAVKVTFYRNGFTVGDGPLRDGKSPEDIAFMKDFEKGYCPKELQPDPTSKGAGKPVNISVDDKRGEDFVPPPKPAYVAFSGEGHRLV